MGAAGPRHRHTIGGSRWRAAIPEAVLLPGSLLARTLQDDEMAALFKAEREADAVRTSQPSASAEHAEHAELVSESAAPMEVEDGAAPSENKPAASQPGSNASLPQHVSTENATTVEVRSLAVHSVLFESAVVRVAWPGGGGSDGMRRPGGG